jgi:hypothetical protein
MSFIRSSFPFQEMENDLYLKFSYELDVFGNSENKLKPSLSL